MIIFLCVMIVQAGNVQNVQCTRMKELTKLNDYRRN